MLNLRLFYIIIKIISFFQINSQKQLYFYKICIFFFRGFFYTNTSMIMLFKKNTLFVKRVNNIITCFVFKKNKFYKKNRYDTKLLDVSTTGTSNVCRSLFLSGNTVLISNVADFVIVINNSFQLIKRDVLMFYVLKPVLNVLISIIDYNRVLYLANIDPLTGIMNRRLVNRLTLKKKRQAENYSQLLLVILIDIDHFKLYNDQLGHLRGDFILKQFALCLKSFTEKGDIVARLGGEEFCIITMQKDQYLVYDKIFNLKKKISEIDVHKDCNQYLNHITASFGICLFSGISNMVMQIADNALFIAKNNGRNKVVMNF